MAATDLRLAPLVDGSKLRPPALRPGVIPRPRLTRARAAAARSRIVLVSAPAGYGKSTLAAEWSDLDPRATGWVRLDRGDNDVVVLLAHLVAALGPLGLDADRPFEELSRARPSIDRVVLPLLAAEIENCSPFVLVLEDTHLVTVDSSRAIIAFLADHVPSGAQLMLVTRGDPGVPLSRLRASRDVFEVEYDLMALDADETRAVAAGLGLELTEELAGILCERTEGWAAAVVLAALVLSGREDSRERVADLSGNQQQIADYLIEEVLAAQSRELTEFLLGTSILERMTAPLCNAVLEIDTAAALIDELARANAFVIAVDDHREWYRYHHLFGELLRAELERRHPELLRPYLLRAASWCELHGRADEAFVYAHAGGDLGQAGRIALANRDRFTLRGQSETVRLWFDRCTDDEIASDTQLALAAAWAFAYQGDEARAQKFIAAAERGSLDVPSVDGATSLRSSLLCLRASVAPAGIPQMLLDAELACAAEKSANTRWYFSGARAAGTALVLLGRSEEAIDPLREVVSTQRPELAVLRVMSLGYLAFAAWDLGDRREAHRWATRAVRMVAEADLDGTVFSAIASAAGARAELERGDHRAASRHVESVRRLRPILRAARWLDADLALRCGEVSLDVGDRPGAVEFAQIADDVLQGYSEAGALPARLGHLQERISLGREYELTAAELRLFHFLPTHLSLQEIADRLHLSRPTVKTQVASIYGKLGVEGRSEAVEAIERLGLGSLPSVTSLPVPHHADPD